MRRVTLGLLLLLVAVLAVGVVVGVDEPSRRALAARFAEPGPVGGHPAPDSYSSPGEHSSSATQPSSDSTRASARSQTPSGPTRPSTEPTPGRRASAVPDHTPRATPTPKPTAKRRSTTPPRKVVYLTFDDGPSAYTPQVLKILRRTGSTATFFQLGVNASGRKRLQAAIRAQGSNIGNHSYDHPDLTRLSAAQLRRQIASGPRSRCFRPPYGATNATVRAAIERAGAEQVLWSVDTLDWQRPGVRALQRFGTSKQVHNGSIILMHDGGGDRTQTVAALPRLIRDLKSRGYAVRALPDCT